MSREIKFRAWDKEYAHMYTNAWPFEHLVYVEMPSHDDKCNPLPINGNKFYNINGKTFYFLMQKHVELMEYTGLKDGKGQEICIGDVLKASRNEYGQKIEEVKEVKYDEYMQLMPLHDIVGYDCELWMDESTYEVIGNIYEHPQLLESK